MQLDIGNMPLSSSYLFLGVLLLCNSKTWKEWTRASLVQAFIIFLYAEMYGFLLTIYLCSRMLGLNISSGNLWNCLNQNMMRPV